MKKSTAQLQKMVLLKLMLLLLLQPVVIAQGTPKYQTFDFLDFDVKVLTTHVTNEENIEYMKTAIANELKSKGLIQSSDPDLVVNIGVVVEEEVQTRETDIRDMHYMGQRNYHWEVQEVPVGTYKVGTVSIDLVDTEQNKLVWSESERDVISKSTQKVRKRIDKGVKKIFRKFDPTQL